MPSLSLFTTETPDKTPLSCQQLVKNLENLGHVVGQIIFSFAIFIFCLFAFAWAGARQCRRQSAKLEFLPKSRINRFPPAAVSVSLLRAKHHHECMPVVDQSASFSKSTIGHFTLFQSFKIRWSTFLNSTEFVSQGFSRLCKCGMFGQEREVLLLQLTTYDDFNDS